MMIGEERVWGLRIGIGVKRRGNTYMGRTVELISLSLLRMQKHQRTAEMFTQMSALHWVMISHPTVPTASQPGTA